MNFNFKHHRDHSALTEESNYDRIKRKRKLNKLLLDIASVIMIISFMLIIVIMITKYA